MHKFCEQAYKDASIESDSIPSPMIDGIPASLEDAVNKAANILRSSSLPLVSGLIADVQACRNAIELTEKIGGIIDHVNGAAIRSGNAVMQRTGEVKSTLAEVRNRADCVIIFSSETLKKFPRLLDRVLLPKKTLGNKGSQNKKIFVLDLAKDGMTQVSSEDNNITQMNLNFPLLESLVYRFQEVVTKPQDNFLDVDEDTQYLFDLINTISKSQYTTLIWSISNFNPESAEQTVQALTEAIKLLMKDVRCVGLPLSGSKGEITANQVATWQTGVPLPVAFTTGVPVHNPVLFDGSNMLRNQEADSLVWLATYSSDDQPPATSVPTIVLGHPKMQCESASVYIPTGVPGIDFEGLAYRTDSVATLPLRKLRSSKLASASEVLKNITQKI